MTTTSPGEKLRHEDLLDISEEGRGMIGPSRTSGAIMPESLSPARNVVVLQ
jgi:hypothetical protein